MNLRIRSVVGTSQLQLEPDASVAALVDAVRAAIVSCDHAPSNSLHIHTITYQAGAAQGAEEAQELRLVKNGVALRHLDQSVGATGLRENGAPVVQWQHVFSPSLTSAFSV